MNIIFYRNDDDKRRINKKLIDGVSMPIFLKRDFDLSNPEITLYDELLVDGGFNYCFIDVLGRYYFVDNMTKINNKMSRLILSCDVLMTYADKIKKINGLINRQIKQGDFYDGFVDLNVRAEVSSFESDVVLKDSQQLILSTVGV